MTSTQEARYRRRLQRGQRAWNLLSRTPAERGERPMAPVRAIGLEQLGLKPGENVLDAGCGVGSFFPGLREAVGDHALRSTFAGYAEPVPTLLNSIDPDDLERFAHVLHKPEKRWGPGLTQSPQPTLPTGLVTTCSLPARSLATNSVG